MTRSAEIDFAPHALPWAGRSAPAPREPPHYDTSHELYKYITNEPTFHRYLQLNNKQPKTYKALSMDKHELSHAHVCYRIDDCGIHNGYKVLVNTS